MKKFWACLVISFILIAILILVVCRFSGPEITTGEHYWQVLLNGSGRELERKGEHVFFFWQEHHGWICLQVSGADIARTLDAQTRKFINDWLGYHKTDNNTLVFDKWDRQQFAALTGYDENSRLSPQEWWLANQKRFIPSLTQNTAFLEKRRALALQRRNIALSEADWIMDDDMLALYNNRLIRHAESRYSKDTDQAITAWLTSHRVWWNWGFEAIYFPALVFYLAYTVPMCLRKLRGRWLRWIMTGTLIHSGFALPFVFGYLPYWLSTRGNQGTIIYDMVFTIAEIPTILCLDAMPHHVTDMIEHGLSWLWNALDHVCYPLLTPINDPRTSFLSFSGGTNRSFILLLGTLLYSSISIAVGGLGLVVRELSQLCARKKL